MCIDVAYDYTTILSLIPEGKHLSYDVFNTDWSRKPIFILEIPVTSTN